MPDDRKYWDAEIETMPGDKLRKIQEEKLRALVARAYEKSVLYRRKFDQAGVKPSDIKTLDDLKKLPLTEYLEDFCNTPFGDILTVPLSEVREIGSTSGTLSGFTQPCFRTHREIELMYDAIAREMWAMGVRPWDIVQILFGWSAVFKNLGATIMTSDAGRGNLDYQVRLAEMTDVTVLMHLASLVPLYLERAKEMGINMKETKLRLIVGSGEPLAEALTRKVESEYGISFRSIYGSTEVGPVASECKQQEGMHILADRCIVEIIDPQTRQTLDLGEEGEVVVTTLQNEATPLIRYRMGDVGSLFPDEPCPCGRTHPRMSLVKGRVAHIIKVKGKKLLPIDVEQVLAGISGLGNEYQIIIGTSEELDRLRVKVETRPGVRELARLKEQTEEVLRQRLGVDNEVELMSPGSLPRALFKAQRLVTT